MKKIKRTEGNIASWVTLILIVLMFFFSFKTYDELNLKFNSSISFMFFMIVIMVILLIIFSLLLFSNEHIKTLGFKIYSFEVWDDTLGRYVEGYNFHPITVSARFILTFRLKDKIETYTYDEFIERQNNSPDNYYLTKKEIMKEINIIISDMIKERNKNNFNKFKNIKEIEELNVETLILQYEEDRKNN